MQPLVVLLLFAGMALVMHGIYEEKLRAAERNVRVEYRFLPRTLYEEQMESTDLLGRYGTMFDRASPWDERNGAGAGKGKGGAQNGGGSPSM